MSIDRQRREAVTKLEQLGYEFDGNAWVKPEQQIGHFERMLRGINEMSAAVLSLPDGRCRLESMTIVGMPPVDFYFMMASSGTLGFPMVRTVPMRAAMKLAGVELFAREK